MTILYDSKCDFCLWFIRFIEAKRQKSVQIDKYDLRTIEARQLLKSHGVNFINLNTIYFVDQEVLVKSKAILRIVRKTSFPYSLLYFFNLLPRKMTDVMYDYVARNRYKLSKLFNH